MAWSTITGLYHHAGPPAARTPTYSGAPCRSACWSVMAVRPPTRAGRSPAGPRAWASTTPAAARRWRSASGSASCRSVLVSAARCSAATRRRPSSPTRSARSGRHGGGPGGVPLRRVDRWRAEGPGPASRSGGSCRTSPAPPASPTARSSPGSPSPRCSCGPSGAIRATDAAVARDHGPDALWVAVVARRRHQVDPLRRGRRAPGPVPADHTSTRPRCRWCATPTAGRSWSGSTTRAPTWPGSCRPPQPADGRRRPARPARGSPPRTPSLDPGDAPVGGGAGSAD